ncbi:MAG: hypothetical protein Q4G26_16455 [Paracoccus sp. (in: a-proteobacteria)]|nr:hypothetical protein [Paracoccus sp. (in: a-proteobacteria)]
MADHIGIAARDLTRRSGRAAPPADQEDDWAEALTVRSLASAFPWLNTFALQGAAKVARLEGSVEFRFLSPDELAARVDALNERFDELIAILAFGGDDNPDDPAMAGLSMSAI